MPEFRYGAVPGSPSVKETLVSTLNEAPFFLFFFFLVLRYQCSGTNCEHGLMVKPVLTINHTSGKL